MRLQIWIAVAGLALPALGFSQAQPIGKAQQIFTLTNQDRQASGLPPLQWNAPLAAAAQAHADRTAQASTLSHQYPGEPPLMQRAAQAGAHFQAIAENIAIAPSPEAVENAWMHSTPHRTNILNPKMNVLGVAVAERNGYVYAVEDFAEADQALTPAQVEQRVRALLSAQNINASAPPAPAEQACRMWRGIPQGTAARSIVRFETPDLTRLPSQVEQQIQSGKFTQAAVGACPSPPGDDFTTYRVAVLFY